ncbi:MAG: GldG family protein [Gammaproteobacteria bacterium]|nr:GldG family protein [Gammaproteobacteria bacterium]MDH5776953.1 GldG family protein [Gammaproteobacteria bacterium]
MEVTKKSRLQFRTQNIIFVVLFLTVISLLAWLSHRYNAEMDWTATGRNTLSDSTIELLKRIPEPVKITSFATDSELVAIRKNIRDMLARYQRYKDDIELIFIDPNTEPDKTRAMGIQIDGELVIEYKDKTEHVTQLKEENITNALQRLLRSGDRTMVFLSGHGERKANGRANHDYGTFFQALGKRGLKTNTLSLSSKPEIPDSAAALVIASPQIPLLKGEVKLIRDFVKKGGNLLWIMDPGEKNGMDKLAQDIGIIVQAGTIVDPTTQALGIRDPSFSIVAEYPPHPITKNFSYLTLFPRACSLKQDEKTKDKSDWDVARFLNSAPQSWVELSAMKGLLAFDEGKDLKGPVAIGLALSRELKTGKGKTEKTNEQRIVVMCDGDFISNAFLGNQGNQQMGENILNWIGHDDSFIEIPIKSAPDKEINLGQGAGITISLIFLVLLPLGLLISGVIIWLKRRKR